MERLSGLLGYGVTQLSVSIVCLESLLAFATDIKLDVKISKIPFR
jgi:hypothetical protein